MGVQNFASKTILLIICLMFVRNGFAQDPNFHVYIGIGQSNMEGMGAISAADKVPNNRFQILEALNCSNLGRTQGSWYPAVPPLTRCDTKLSIMDYFGRTLADSLPANIKIGAIVVAVGDSKIELWDKANYASYLSTAPSWVKNWSASYANNPYGRMIEMAKIAQKSGVIKGILLHQGEANSYPPDPNWPTKVRNVYRTIIADLGLDSNNVPLLAGEVVGADQNGSCAGMNKVIDTLPRVLKQAHVISSLGVPDTTDNIHFSAGGVREFGKRYAIKMLSLLDSQDPPTPAQQLPYKDTIQMPGKIEAENYDKGGQGVSYNDDDVANSGNVYRTDGVDIEESADSGYVIGWTVAGEWLEYTVKVESDGPLAFTAKVASGADASSFSLSLDNDPITSTVLVPNTGDWKTFTTVTGTTKSLSAGTYVLRLNVEASYFNMDWIEFSIPSVLIGKLDRLDNKSSLEMFRVFNLQGTQVGEIFLSNGQEIENHVRKLTSKPGTYILRPLDNRGKTQKVTIK